MNTLDMNATGKMVALANAGADCPEGVTDARARPSRENEATPTTKVTTATGILSASISRPYNPKPTASIISEPSTAMKTPEPTTPPM